MLAEIFFVRIEAVIRANAAVNHANAGDDRRLSRSMPSVAKLARKLSHSIARSLEPGADLPTNKHNKHHDRA